MPIVGLGRPHDSFEVRPYATLGTAMDDKVELCWRMYLENTTHGRHHETMRASITTLIAAIAGGSLGLIKTDSPSCAQLPLVLLIVGRGTSALLSVALRAVRDAHKLRSHLASCEDQVDALRCVKEYGNPLRA